MSEKANVDKADYRRKSPIEDTYKLVKRVADSRFGDCVIIQNQHNQRLLLKEKVSNSESDASKDIASAKHRMDLNHPHLQKMEDWSCTEKSDFCSKFYKVRGYYSWPNNDLAKEMVERQKNGSEFSHEELTHLVYQILDSSCWLHRNNTSFDDIRPAFIGVSADCTEYCLLDRLADPSPAERAQMNRFLSEDKLYMSPSLFEGLKNMGKKINHDSKKSDSFSLGMTVLEAGSGHEIQDVYDKKTNKVNEMVLAQHLNSFRAKFGGVNSLLCDIVENLLQADEDKRLGCCQLLEQIPPYSSIKDHFSGDIMVEQAPIEMHKEVVVEHDAPRHEIVQQISPAKEIIRREPQIIRSTAPVEVRRVVMDKQCGETIRRSYKTQEYVPKVIEECKEEKIVERIVTKEPEVIRMSHQHKGEVVRTSKVVRRVEGEHTHQPVVRRIEGEHTHQPHVIRRSVVDNHQVEGVRRVVQEGHTHGEVRTSKVVRRVEGEKVVTSEPTIIRQSGDHIHTGETVVRRIEGEHTHQPVVRRIEGEHTHQPNVVRRSVVHHGGEYVPTQGVTRVVAGDHHHAGHGEVRTSKVIRRSIADHGVTHTMGGNYTHGVSQYHPGGHRASTTVKVYRTDDEIKGFQESQVMKQVVNSNADAMNEVTHEAMVEKGNAVDELITALE